MYPSDKKILNEIILSKNISSETVRKLYKQIVNIFCIYQKVNFIDITSDDKKELIQLREELRKIQQKLAENGY